MLALRKTEAAEGLALAEVPDPGPPGPAQVRLDIVATGICGTDLSVERWEPGYHAFMQGHLPVTIGHETVARVAAIGTEVTNLGIGDLVVVNPAIACGRCPACRAGDPVGCSDRQAFGLVRDGAFAAHALAPAAYCYKLPANVPPELGALAEPLSVGMHALLVGGFMAGLRVAVFGPGPIGQGVAVLARQLGAADVVIVGRDDGPRLQLLREMGFETLIDLAEAEAAERLAAMPGVALAVEAAGVPEAAEAALSLLAPEGVLALAGMGDRPARIDLGRVVKYRLQLRGASRIPPFVWPLVLDALAADPGAFAPLVTHRLPLTQADAAFALCRSRIASKVLLLPD
jgi:threonine dehydrogenase-like Zn-dependent dehydrogenase